MFDYDHRLATSAAFTASGAGAIGATAKIIDWGAGKVHGEAVIDVSAIELASNNELYTLLIQGSTSSSFAGTFTALASLELGAKEVLDGDQDSAIGRYRLSFSNEMPDGTVYPYGRLYCSVAGSVTTGITFSAHLEKPKS